MRITEILKDRRLFLDGGTGTLLQAAGLSAGELPETWNIKYPERIASVHRAYFDAGSDVVCTNTFGANILKYGEDELCGVINAAVRIADGERRAAEAKYGREKFVALDIGPLGKLLKPFGELDFEDAVGIFAKTVKLGAEAGADVVFFETFTDTYELKAAIVAAKESCDLPIFASCAFDASGKLMTGADVPAVVALCEGLGVAAVGANCGVGPDLLLPVAEKLFEYASVPVIIKPNAGLPREENGKTVFDLVPVEFARNMTLMSKASLMGGCCGTTPAHIEATVKAMADAPYAYPEKKTKTLVSSYSHAVELGERPVLIGERINPTGKKAFKEALRNHDIGYILNQATLEEKAGAQILDVNVGLPEIDETEMMVEAVTAVQSVIDLPLQIDTSTPATMEAALRVVNGKPLINSVNGKKEVLEAVLPLAKKYGGVVVGLTLDEDGIPDTAEGRAKIAGRIIETAEKYGIDKKDIIIDTLTLTVSTDPRAATVTLEALRLIRERYGVGTCLGVSNVSFGLPERDRINSSFFTLALGAGLTAAIMNPLSEAMMNAYRNYLALAGFDAGCADYIASASTSDTPKAVSAPTVADLRTAVVSGLKDAAAKLAEAELRTKTAMEIIDGMLIPALTEVGDGFAEKRIFLPQLLMSAEAAGAAFEVIRANMPSTAGTRKYKIVLATVKGDIHDIGKNIVRALLENYNYEVIDLGRDVPPEKIVEITKKSGAPLVGLSALMTTTVPAMGETVKQLRSECPNVKIMVGGAVLTEDYSNMLGADHYSPDAMDAVKYAESLNI